MDSVSLPLSPSTGPVSPVPGGAKDPAALMAAARDFEATFIQQMLQYAGLGEAFGSSEGMATESFSSFVLERIAKDMVDEGGFGLADQFYQKLSTDYGYDDVAAAYNAAGGDV